MLIDVRVMEMLLSADLLLFCVFHSGVFSKDGSQSLRGPGIRGDGGGLPVTGMTTLLGMGRG